MEFLFDINDLFPNEINKIDRNTLTTVPDSRNRSLMSFSYRNRIKMDQMLEVIDSMGISSATAQGLNHAITSGTKLRESDHILYLMTESNANNGKGSVTGILKMGMKRLFLIDEKGNQHEMMPQCVLDFYVHELCQRRGYGKILFEFMMKDLKIGAHQLAIDRPSPKFLSFLRRHYRLSNPVHQLNHFTVFPEIFPKTVESNVQNEKFRRSEPGFISSVPKAQTSNRQSYPPTTSSKKQVEEMEKTKGSVASVVFGQLHATNIHCKDSFSPRCQPKVDRTLEQGANLEIFRPAVDSSFNIFGVPSTVYSHGGSATGNRG